MKKLLHNVEEFLGVYRWHPKIALRYLPIVDKIKHSNIVKPSVLEIGSGSLGIAPYLKQQVTGLDITFEGPKFSLLKQVKGSATHIPFDNKSFDFVIAVDMLEHVPKNLREKVAFESMRVARHGLIIAVPCGELSEGQDRELAQHYEQLFKKPFAFCDEHVEFGLPTVKEMENILRNVAKNLRRTISIEIRGNINLTTRKFFMKGWMTNNMFVDFFFRKVLLLTIPLVRLFNQEPTYRKIFFVSFQNHD